MESYKRNIYKDITHFIIMENTTQKNHKGIFRFIAYGDEERIKEYYTKKYNAYSVSIIDGDYETIRNGKVGRTNCLIIVIY